MNRGQRARIARETIEILRGGDDPGSAWCASARDDDPGT